MGGVVIVFCFVEMLSVIGNWEEVIFYYEVGLEE